MVVVNAIVYKESGEGFIAEGYEIAQLGHGTTDEEAKQVLLSSYKSLLDLAKQKEDRRVLSAAHATRRCEKGLQKIILSGTADPDIRLVEGTNVEVHFYRELKK